MVILLRKYRLERGWTLEHVAKQIGVTKTAIHDLEVGKRIGSVPVWDALEDLFGVPQRQLRAIEKEPGGNQANETTSKE